MIVYFNKKFIPLDEAAVSPFDRGYQFGDGAYEVIRYYGNSFFRMKQHIKRLKYSLNELKINFKDYDSIEKAAGEIIVKNNLDEKDSLVYIQVSRGASFPRKHLIPGNIDPTIFIYASEFTPRRGEQEKGVPVKLEEDIRWGRCDIKSTLLLPNSIAKQNAFNHNAAEAVFVRDGFIQEGSHTSFGGVKNDAVFFPQYSNFILRSVTREAVKEICKINSIKVIEAPLHKENIKSFDEFFLLGTSIEVTPVIQIDDWKINAGKPGSFTAWLQKMFKALVEESIIRK